MVKQRVVLLHDEFVCDFAHCGDGGRSVTDFIGIDGDQNYNSIPKSQAYRCRRSRLDFLGLIFSQILIENGWILVEKDQNFTRQRRCPRH